MAARKLKPEAESVPQNNKPGGNTSWKNGVPAAGWYKMPDAWWRDLPRLQRGLYQRMLIEYIWASMCPRESAGAMPEWSGWFSYVEMSEVFRCSPEQVRDDVKDAGKRGLMMVDAPDGTRGKVRFQITWSRWESLKDYVAPRPVPVPEKPVKQVRWLSRAVTVEPGQTFDLPKLDFTVERISLRNTSETGNIKIGAGSCEGGVLVLETASEPAVKESTVSKKKRGAERDCTPVFSKSSPKAVEPVVQQILDAIGTYGPVTLPAVTRLIATSHASPEKVLESISAIRADIPQNAPSPVGWLMTMVPQHIAGTYTPKADRKKKQTERERLSQELWGPKEKKSA